MNAISLNPQDIAIAASLVAFDAALSVALRLRLHRQLLISAARMVVQLIAVGFLLRLVFAMHHPVATLALVVVMALIAAREIAARSEHKLTKGWGLMLSTGSVLIATVVTVVLALATAIRPQPWYDARYAVTLTGIILGSVLNSGSLALDSLLSGVGLQRTAIEARLALGSSFREAVAPLVREAEIGRAHV